MHKIITTLAVVAMLALPGVTTAQAQGNAGVDEYTETIPGGDGANNPSGEAGNPTGAGPLTPAQVAALEAQGDDGAAAAKLAQSTGPERKIDAAGSNPSAAKDSGGAGIADVISNLGGDSDSEGMGLALPIILGAILLGAIAFVIIGRNRSQTDTTA